MAERVGTVENGRRFTAHAPNRSAPRKQISHERLAARYELVRQHVPRACLQTPVAQERRQFRGTLGPHGQIILQHDRLTIEQEALARRGWMIQQFVHQWNKPLAESFSNVIPLAIPVGVRDDVNLEWMLGHSAGVRGAGAAKRRRG